ncbi:hypothetical protein Tco_0438212 [Tanacetum coccineum]
MASNVDKFEVVDFRRWQKKMHFLLSSMSVVYVLTTPIPEYGGDDATVEQIRKRAKWDNDDYVCRDSLEAKYMAENASSKKFLIYPLHNSIMAAGSRDRPPMLATGRYVQWRSRFLRYIDTRPNGDALRKCILNGPYTPTIVTTPAVPATEDSPAVPKQTTVETVMNMTPENRAHFESEKEAINLILTGIGDEIYPTVDACQTSQEMWGKPIRKATNKGTKHNLSLEDGNRTGEKRP